MINLKLDPKGSEELTDFLQTLIEAYGINSTQYKVLNINLKASKGITLKLEDYDKPTNPFESKELMKGITEQYGKPTKRETRDSLT